MFEGDPCNYPEEQSGGVREIGLLEYIYKLISQIINLYLSKAIYFWEKVYEFWEKYRTFTIVGKTKLRIQIATYQLDVLYQVYLDLSKEYDSIDRNKIVQLLKKYKIGSRLFMYVEKV